MADTDAKICAKLEEAGIDCDRLAKALASGDAWGKLVNSFEYLTTLGIVVNAWRAGIAGAEATSKTKGES